MNLPYICSYKRDSTDPAAIVRSQGVTIVKLMRGLGDTIYQRPFVHGGYVDSTWPELFEDRPDIKFVEPITGLRTQQKNLKGKNGWHYRPFPHTEKPIHYSQNSLAIAKNITRAIEDQLMDGGTLPAESYILDLPDFGPSPVAGEYVLIKPNTVREEWCCPARNCSSQYLREAVGILKEKGIKTIGIADISQGEEWLDGVPPDVDDYYYEGEFDIKQLVSLVRGAKLMVSSVGWPVPMCLATETKLICIGGGLGRHNNPEMITDPRMNLDNFSFIEPDRYCMCGDMRHKCDKTITGFSEKFREAMG